MTEDGILVRARIDFLTAMAGGRSAPLKAGTRYRPNHNFLSPENRIMAIGEIIVPEDRDVLPGESLEVLIVLFASPDLYPEITTGRRWGIQEGPKLVAYGTVLERLMS